MATIALPDPRWAEFAAAQEKLMELAPQLGMTYCEVYQEQGPVSHSTRSWGVRQPPSDPCQ